MPSVRRLIFGSVLVLLAAACAGGAYVWKLWHQSDELLRQLALDKISAVAPDWHVSIGAARFDFQGRIHLAEVRLLEVDGATPLLDIKEVILTLDRDKLADPDPPLRKVVLVRPKVRLARGIDGIWNWQRLPPPNPPNSALPEFRCERCDVTVQLDDPAGGPPDSFRFEEGDLQFVPSGKRQFVVQARTRWDRTDELACDGKWNVDGRTWELRGSARNLRIDSSLLKIIERQSARAQSGFAVLRNELARLPVSAAPRTAGREENTADVLSLAADVQFQLARRQPAAELEYRADATILSGDCRSASWPYPLHNLRGHIECDGKEIRISDFSAHSGSTRLAIEQGMLPLEGQATFPTFDLVLDDLPLDKRLVHLLPEALQRVHAAIRPQGLADARLHVAQGADGRWEHAGRLELKGISAQYETFPYRIDQIQGAITRQHGQLKLELTGLAGSRPVSMQGTVENPGTEAAVSICIESTRLPIDKKLYAACPRRFQNFIDQLELQGEVDGQVWLYRKAGPGQKLEVEIVGGKLHDGSVRCKAFPYPLGEVSADFEGSGDEWDVSNIAARRGPAVMHCDKAYWRPDPQTGQGRLVMGFDVDTVPLDKALFDALPFDWQENWTELSPQGNLAAGGSLVWSAGNRPHLKFEAQLFDGKLHLRSFPLPLENVQAKLFVDSSKVGSNAAESSEVIIKSLQAQYEDTDVNLDGYVTSTQDGEWRVKFENISVDDIEPTRAVRKALPEGLASVLDACNLRGKVSIRGMLEFRGKRGGRHNVTAAWETRTVYTNNTVTAGIDLKHMYGTADFRGIWDGETVRGDGLVDLSAVNVFGYAFEKVQGPVRIAGNRLTIGNERALNAAPPATIDGTRRLKANFVGGELGLDADVNLDTMQYKALITMARGDLKRYAQLYMPGSRNLAGVINGWVELRGAGADPKRLEGRGNLLIAPAALYELPVIVAVLNTLGSALTFAPARNTAFDKANFQFNVGNGAVRFERIDLVGDAVSLIGRGTVRFDSAVDLDFYSSGGSRNPLAQIPLVGKLVGDVAKMASTGWVRITVGGTVKDPKPQTQALPPVDDALRQLLGIFDTRAPARR